MPAGSPANEQLANQLLLQWCYLTYHLLKTKHPVQGGVLSFPAKWGLQDHLVTMALPDGKFPLRGCTFLP